MLQICKLICVKNSLQLLLKPHFLLFLYLVVWLRPHTDYKVCCDTWLLLLIDLWFTNATKFLPNFLQLIYSVEERVERLFSLGNEFSPHYSSRFSRSQSSASCTSCKDRNGSFFSNMCICLWPSHPLRIHMALQSIITCARRGFLNGSSMLSCIIDNMMMRQKKKENKCKPV